MQQENVIQVLNDPLAQELLVRGTASIEVIDGAAPEYLERRSSSRERTGTA